MTATSTGSTPRRVLVTGANKGIGLAIVRGVLDHADDTFALLGSRDRARGEAARAEILEARPEWADRVEVLPIDVSSDPSVSEAAAVVRARFDGEAHPLHGVVNNAGIGRAKGGLREILDVNARGIHRVCTAFLPLLPPRGGRVVNVTSASGPNFVHGCSEVRQRFLTDPAVTWSALEAFMDECLSLDGPEAFAERGLGKGDAYGISKAVGNALTLHLAREYPDLSINACTPGFIETDMTRPWAEAAGKPPAEMGMKSPSEGARAPLHLLFGELEGNGRYYGSDAQRSPLDRYRSPGDPPYTGD